MEKLWFNFVKNYLIAFLVGSAFGTLATSLLAPSLIAWYFEPPVALGVSCKDAALWSVGTFQKLQWVSVLVGGVITVSLWAWLKVSRKTKQIQSN